MEATHERIVSGAIGLVEQIPAMPHIGASAVYEEPLKAPEGTARHMPLMKRPLLGSVTRTGPPLTALLQQCNMEDDAREDDTKAKTDSDLGAAADLGRREGCGRDNREARFAAESESWPLGVSFVGCSPGIATV
jgi:hypothetical protein